MSVLTPSVTKGKLFLSGTSAFRTGDDSSDKFVTGVYSHEAKEYSATEADEIKSFLMLVQEIMLAGGSSINFNNDTGGTLTKGTLVYPSGYNGTRLTVTKADADSTTKPAMFVIDDDVANAANGVAYSYKDVTGDVTYPLDTSSFSAVGSKVYLSATAGGFSIAPTGASQVLQWVGIVLVKDATVGSVRFFPGMQLKENFILEGSAMPNEANTAGSGAPNVLTSAESFKLLTNEGATAENYHTLPTAVAGLYFEFVCQDTDGIRITAAAGDTIRLGEGAANVTKVAGYIQALLPGASVVLKAINATEWMSVGAPNGTWTVEVS